MKKLFLIGFLLCGLFSAHTFAETVSEQITDGRLFISGNARDDYNNSLMKTPLFSVLGSLGGDYSPWTDICKRTPVCTPGKTFTVPEYSQINLGGCIGCSGAQFPYGTFTIGGTTYQNAYFKGNFSFSRVAFSIPKRLKRRGTIIFRKPFTVTGNLKVCQVSDRDAPCPSGKILFDGEITGKGILTATMEIKLSNNGSFANPYLFQNSFEYKFEK